MLRLFGGETPGNYGNLATVTVILDAYSGDAFRAGAHVK